MAFTLSGNAIYSFGNYTVNDQSYVNNANGWYLNGEHVSWGPPGSYDWQISEYDVLTFTNNATGSTETITTDGQANHIISTLGYVFYAQEPLQFPFGTIAYSGASFTLAPDVSVPIYLLNLNTGVTTLVATANEDVYSASGNFIGGFINGQWFVYTYPEQLSAFSYETNFGNVKTTININAVIINASNKTEFGLIALVAVGSQASTNGTIGFIDTFSSPSWAASSVAATPTATDVHGNPVSLSSEEMATIEGDFHITPQSGSTSSDTVSWSFTPNGNDLKFITGGETVSLPETVTVADGGQSDTATITVKVSGVTSPLFTAGADTVNFNNLTPDQLTAIQNAPTSIYNGLGGNDTVTLPDIGHYELGTTGVTWDPSQTFVESDTAGQDVTLTGGNAITNIQVGDGNDLISVGGLGGTVTAGNGNNTITSTLAPNYLLPVSQSVVVGNGDSAINLGTAGGRVTIGSGSNTIVSAAIVSKANPKTNATTIGFNGVDFASGATFTNSSLSNYQKRVPPSDPQIAGTYTNDNLSLGGLRFTYQGSNGVNVSGGAQLDTLSNVQFIQSGNAGGSGAIIPLDALKFTVNEGGSNSGDSGLGTISVTDNDQPIPGVPSADVPCAYDQLMPVPDGTYQIIYRTNAHAGLAFDFSDYKGQSWFGPQRTNIQLHVGNFPGDFAGCIVVGSAGADNGFWNNLTAFMGSILGGDTTTSQNNQTFYTLPVPITIQINDSPAQPILHIKKPIIQGNSATVDFKIDGIANDAPLRDKDITFYFEVSGAKPGTYTVSNATEFLPGSNIYEATIVGSHQDLKSAGNAAGGANDVNVTINYGGLSPANLSIQLVSPAGTNQYYDGETYPTLQPPSSYDPPSQPLINSTSLVPQTIYFPGSGGSITGNLQDGYISGATVFADANGSGKLDPGEASITTNANGNFTLTSDTGPLIAFGGTDISTDLAFKGTLELPAGSSVIDPLTTLIVGLQSTKGLTVAAANQDVLAAFGLPSGLDLTTLDPIAGVQSGDTVSAEAYAAGAKVIDTADAIASAFATASAGFLGAFEAAFASLETDIKTLAAGQTLNLTNQQTITALVNSVAKTEGVDDTSFVSPLSTNILASNAEVDAKLSQDGASSSLITDVSTVQAAIQSSTFDLTKGADTVTGEAENDTIIAASTTLSSGDKIDGGGGSLALEGPGTFNLALPTTLTNIKTITATEGQAAYSGGGQTFTAQNQIVVLRAGLNATVNVESDTSLNANDPKPATITIVGAANSDVINLASGNDLVTVGGSNETVNLGSGNDTINVDAATIGATIGDGTGHNTLDVTGGGTMAMGSNIADIAEALLSPASTAYRFTANAISGLTVDDSSTTTADVLTAGGAHQTLTGGGAGRVEFIGATAGDDTFKNLAALFNGDTISGLGNNGDVIDLTDVSSTGLKPLSYVQTTATSGKLTVSDGVHTAAITLLGQYMANDFHPTSDGGVGTAITYQLAPLAVAQTASQHA